MRSRTSRFIILLIASLICVLLVSSTPIYNQIFSIRNVRNSTIKFYPCIAVLVDFRTVNQIVSIVHNVNQHIPSSWPIQIFHGKNNQNFIQNSTLAPLIASRKIFLTLMEEVYDRSRTSELLTDPKFWERVRGEKILLFQIDSVMCSNSPHKITDFLQYDYVGAPWDLSWFGFNKAYLVGNGGFSLRSRSKILALLALVKYDVNIPEDVWYAQNLHRVNASIPSVEIAKTFAVESIYYEIPLGVHRFRGDYTFRGNLARTCPESMLVTTDVQYL
ncbi:unnamed protein product [Rotaria socialis]|uniref:DUF5672 domain-containing protein n=1 Tax=Rotaria socialis TaxID=392032 RepID=A0A820VGC3_9BILA|nr:unnamed protein product [Rotaria socialis]CAF3464229.1 unnamed protein product [Rotaria socialis]CAF3499639.1 unnamed protein product [Rotaria socialis]CAF3508851.1 unnamed protein product [Rotaria socialis]CAF3668526.1 unnamed protein product [Rotaria socialis]